MTLFVTGLLISTFGWIYLVQDYFIINPVIVTLITTATIAVFLTIIMHIIADSLTTQGVRVFWPDTTYVEAIPKDMRFSNTSAGSSVVL